jgi:rod shape-determining protein MreC
METLLGRYKNLIVLAAILFAQLIALAVQVKRPTQEGEIRLIRLWAIGAVTPFEKAVVHTQTFFHDKWTGYLWLRGVRKENADLKAEIERMKLEQARLSEDANMARRIQTLLAFKEQYIDQTVAAQVIGTSGSEQSRVLYIDKGSNDGLKPDMAVITPTGIVGKIVQVSASSAQVLPINDQLSGVGAALKDSRLQGILKGALNGTTTLQYIMSDEPVKPGESVITSGGDRIFPKGLLVGTVASIEPGKDLFLNIRVIPSARLDRLEEVLVVTKIQEKFPDAKELGPIRASDILSERLPGVPTPPDANPAGNAAGTTGGAATAGPGNTSTGATTTKPAASAGAMQPGTNGAGAVVRKPVIPAGSTPGSSAVQTKPAAGTTSPAKPTQPNAISTGTATTTPPVRKPPVTTPADMQTTPDTNRPKTPPSNPLSTPPATQPNTGETPPQ